jgi:protein ImuB
VAEDFEATLFFLDGISYVEGLRFPMKRLLDDFCRFLRQRQLSCARFTWRFAHEDKSRQSLVIASARGEPQAARFMQLSELKLEHFRISAPVEAVTLIATEFQAQTDTRLALLPDPGQEDDKAMELLDRLRARLGVDACQIVAPGNSLRPEQEQGLGSCGSGFSLTTAAASGAAVRLKPDPQVKGSLLGQQRGIEQRSVGERGIGHGGIDGQPSPLFAQHTILRPFWIWPEPKAVRVIDGQLWWQGAFMLLSRPERIALPWWEDGDTRDYYLARHDNGVHYWIYFSQQAQAWFCQGVFG